MGFPRNSQRRGRPPTLWRFEGFYRQFDDFDPLEGVVPANPLPSLPFIAARARNLVRSRTRSELGHAASKADWLIDQYFREKRIPGRISLYREWVDQDRKADESTAPVAPGSVSTAIALAESLAKYALDDDPQFKYGQDFEYLAVLGLWKIADAILHFSLLSAVESSAEHPGIWTPDSTETEHSLWAEDAVVAMEATCWAEWLKHQAIRVEELVQDKVKKRVSLAAQRAAIQKNAENRQMKAEAFAYYQANHQKFHSMDAAAEAIAGKIVPLKFRTVRNWIPDFRRVLQSARTP